jgi:hypothetical protein
MTCYYLLNELVLLIGGHTVDAIVFVVVLTDMTGLATLVVEL